ncbi:MAG: Cytochrome peroxidase, partial [Myxococcaceae bacterium]|nr:Cytochrome peroxidase [Myxococcaceae bacterium]
MASVLRRITPAALLVLGCSSPPAPVDAAAPVDASAPVDVAEHHDGHDVGAAPDARVVGRCPDGGALPYPAAAEVSFKTPLPDLTLATGDAPLRLSRFYAPCAAEPRLLVVRVMAAWSGPSQHHAAHTRRLLDLPDAARLDLVDVLVSAADNLAPDDRDLADWRARYDAAPTALARSDAATWRPLSIGPQHLPLVLLVDPRTMGYVQFFDAPDTHDLPFEVADALARLDRR